MQPQTLPLQNQPAVTQPQMAQPQMPQVPQVPSPPAAPYTAQQFVQPQQTVPAYAQPIPVSDEDRKDRRTAVLVSSGSIVFFIVVFLIGYVMPLGGLVALYGIKAGAKSKSTAAIVIGTIGAILNFGAYLLTFLV